MVNRRKLNVLQFRPRQRVPPRLRKESKIMKKSRKDLRKTQENMRCSQPAKQYPLKNSNVQLEEKIVEKGASKSHRVQPVSKDMKQPTTLSKKNLLISSEKQKISTLSRSKVDTNARLKKPCLLKKKKGEVLQISSPIRLKVVSNLAHKETKRLKERPNFDQTEDIIARKDGTKKLEWSKSTKLFTISRGPNTPMESKPLIPKNNCSNECKERHDEGCASCGDRNKQEGTESLKGNQHMQELQTNSYTFGKDISKCLRDKALCKKDGHSPRNVDQGGLTEINLSRVIGAKKCDGKTNKGIPKKRKEPLLEEKPKTIADNDSIDVQGNNMDSSTMKKQRCLTSKDKDQEVEEGAEDGGGDHNHMVVEDDIARYLSHATISKDGHTKVSMPSCVELQHHCCSKHVDKPTWRGIFKIDEKEYISLTGHLSTKSCEKVWSLSRQLVPLVELKMLPRSEVWPKAWEASKPNDNNIGMYFFHCDTRQDKDLDQLIKKVMENDLVLRAIISDAEMLIFPSILLPDHHQTFQRKHYLWGVFKRREAEGVVVAEPSATVHCGQEVEKLEKQQHVLNQQDDNVQCEEPDQEMMLTMSATSHRLPAKNSQVEASHVKGPPSMGFDLKGPEKGTQAKSEATPVTNAAASPANHGQIDPSMGLPLGRLMGFVTRQTPKVQQLIREMEREGALVFAMEGESLGAGSWPGNMASAVQK